ncbi:MAG TPA: hypothetical protein PLZ43_14310 [bacterium]|nr:hypothetical protein [bacterium]
MSLIEQIRNAVKIGDIQEPFSTEDIEIWADNKKITKSDGRKYAESSIRSILSNSDNKNMPTTNKNKKCLKSKIVNGKKVYSFD